MRRIFTLLCVTLALLCSAALAEETEQPVLRALIVTCDRFVSQESTTPAAQENAMLMERMLQNDARGYAVIRTESDTIASVDAFRAAAMETFAGANEDDISLIYISTHGIYNPARSNLTAELLLSDGTGEEGLTAQMLESVLAAIPGTHVLLMDACHSGAIIGKGLSNRADRVAIAGSKVLCSAGGSEDSWYWRAGDSGALHGAGYFTSILTRGCDPEAGFPADSDSDGRVSLYEASQWLREHYAVSTPQAYPERDTEFTLFACGEAAEPAGIVAVDFDDTVFSGGLSEIRFTLELASALQPMYQLVYQRQGVWDFAHAVQAMEPRALEPGVYERALALTLPDEEEASGYLMLQIFSNEDGRPVLHESRLISVLPTSGDIALSAECAYMFVRTPGRELPIIIRHDIPCVLTVRVQNARGDTVRYLAYQQQTRPQHLVPEGTCLYWDGTLADGQSAPQGYYTVRVQVEIGGDLYQSYAPFRIVDSGSAG